MVLGFLEVEIGREKILPAFEEFGGEDWGLVHVESRVPAWERLEVRLEICLS